MPVGVVKILLNELTVIYSMCTKYWLNAKRTKSAQETARHNLNMVDWAVKLQIKIKAG